MFKSISCSHQSNRWSKPRTTMLCFQQSCRGTNVWGHITLLPNFSAFCTYEESSKLLPMSIKQQNLTLVPADIMNGDLAQVFKRQTTVISPFYKGIHKIRLKFVKSPTAKYYFQLTLYSITTLLDLKNTISKRHW